MHFKIFIQGTYQADILIYLQKILLILLKKKYNLSIAGEWWFGNDFVDLYRVIYLNQKSLDKKEYIKIFQSNFIKYLDSMQKILDKNKISSEVHIIFKKN